MPEMTNAPAGIVAASLAPDVVLDGTENGRIDGVPVARFQRGNLNDGSDERLLIRKNSERNGFDSCKFVHLFERNILFVLK